MTLNPWDKEVHSIRSGSMGMNIGRTSEKLREVRWAGGVINIEHVA